MSKISEKLRLYAKSIDDELKQIDIFLSRPNLDTSQVQFASGKMRAYIDILVDLEDTYPELNDREIEGDELDIRRLLEYDNRIEDSVKAQTRTMLSKPIELFSSTSESGIFG